MTPSQLLPHEKQLLTLKMSLYNITLATQCVAYSNFGERCEEHSVKSAKKNDTGLCAFHQSIMHKVQYFKNYNPEKEPITLLYLTKN